MRAFKLVTWIIGILLVAWLILTVVYDANAEPEGACEDQTGSVCTESSSCPDEFKATNKYTCFNNGMLCCVPS